MKHPHKMTILPVIKQLKTLILFYIKSSIIIFEIFIYGSDF